MHRKTEFWYSINSLDVNGLMWCCKIIQREWSDCHSSHLCYTYKAWMYVCVCNVCLLFEYALEDYERILRRVHSTEQNFYVTRERCFLFGFCMMYGLDEI